jgi:phospholipid/cholesterol/gamma-HCH transport system substrate-binding protein
VRRLAFIASVLAVTIVAAVIVVGRARSSGATSGPYVVRAIFDDASYAATGEDVEIAGANVGSISSLGITSSNRAAVTITIDNSEFAPFYANAHCTIRPQSLIGDEYVNCDPGTSSHPRLTRIAHGAGAGDYLLPVTRTSSPIDTDIVQDISTEPVRESLAVIIGELGTGLAARGSDLNAVIRRANPALGNTDKVVKILDSQDRTLARLATSSEQVLAPLARERRQIAGFVIHADTTAVAAAQRADDISKTFHEFPSFLRQLRPLMADLGTLSDQGTPVMSELGTSAASLGRQFAELTPFARSARTALIDLGNAAQHSQSALVDSEPLARRLLAVGRNARPSATSLDTLLQSLNRTGGIEQLMNVLYEGTAAGNGFNKLGHYVRVQPITGSCTNYAVVHNGSCSADFTTGHSGASASSRPAAESRPGSRADVRETVQQAIVDRALATVAAQPSASSVSSLLGYLMGSAR